jgi:hypothetical protein
VYVLHTYVLIGMKHTSLRFLEEHRVYSLSKKETATMLLVMQYDDQTVNSRLKEMPLEVLIDRSLLALLSRLMPSVTHLFRSLILAMFGWYRLVLVVVVVFNTSKLTHKKLTPWMFGWRC